MEFIFLKTQTKTLTFEWISNEAWHQIVFLTSFLHQGLFIDFALFHEEFCFLLLFFTTTWSLKKFQTTKHKHLEHSVMVDVFHSKVFVRCANRKTVLFEIIFNKNQAFS